MAAVDVTSETSRTTPADYRSSAEMRLPTAWLQTIYQQPGDKCKFICFVDGMWINSVDKLCITLFFTNMWIHRER